MFIILVVSFHMRCIESRAKFMSVFRPLQILRLLEVPGEKVTASSAAFALQRLSQLCSATGNDEMDSFIRKAVLHELCETVIQGLPQLLNSTVVSLAGHAALASSGYDVEFVHRVNNEVCIITQYFTLCGCYATFSM